VKHEDTAGSNGAAGSFYDTAWDIDLRKVEEKLREYRCGAATGITKLFLA
jgi:hypothetical protein